MCRLKEIKTFESTQSERNDSICVTHIHTHKFMKIHQNRRVFVDSSAVHLNRESFVASFPSTTTFAVLAHARSLIRFKLFYDYEPATLLPKYIFFVCVNCVARIWLVHHAVAQYEIVKTFFSGVLLLLLCDNFWDLIGMMFTGCPPKKLPAT